MSHASCISCTAVKLTFAMYACSKCHARPLESWHIHSRNCCSTYPVPYILCALPRKCALPTLRRAVSVCSATVPDSSHNTYHTITITIANTHTHAHRNSAVRLWDDGCRDGSHVQVLSVTCLSCFCPLILRATEARE
jgi:hypothetical protein